MARSQRPLWRCPECGHRFVTKNLSHSCGNYRLADHFTGTPPSVRQSFNRWVAVARKAGPVTVYAQKTRIVFQSRVRFAGAVVKKTWLDAGIWVRRPVKHPRLVRTEYFGRLGYVHHFRIERPTDIDDALEKLIREAYEMATHPNQ
jgi:uncharacterized protein DUF5655